MKATVLFDLTVKLLACELLHLLPIGLVLEPQLSLYAWLFVYDPINIKKINIDLKLKCQHPSCWSIALGKGSRCRIHTDQV